MYFPVSVTVTDYAVRDPHAVKMVGTCVMNVVPGTLRVNGGGVR